MINEYDKQDINDFAIRLLKDTQYCKEQHEAYIASSYCFAQIDGVFSPAVLKETILAASDSEEILEMLPEMLLYVDRNSVTDEVFQLLLNTPSDIRISCLSNLGHAELAFYQMQILNRFPLALEAFSWLFDQICHFDIFSKEDMLQILRENYDVTPQGIQNCIELAYAKYGNSEKLNEAIHWVEVMKLRNR